MQFADNEEMKGRAAVKSGQLLRQPVQTLVMGKFLVFFGLTHCARLLLGLLL